MALKIYSYILVCCIVFVLSSAQDCGIAQNVEDKNTKLPWVVKIHERYTDEVICMGTLISNRHVLVAAHCLWPKSYHKHLKVISNVYATIGNDVPLDLMDVKIYSDWKFNRVNYDADIAIVSLFNPVSNQPICLAPFSGPFINIGGIVAGISGDDKSNVRQKVDVEKNSECFNNFPATIKEPSLRTFCANWPGEDLEINGFSGAYYYQQAGQNNWFIQGIESQSFVQKNQCDIKKHSVFSNVGFYLDWINKIVKRDTEKQWKDTELKCTFVKNYEGLYGCEVENLIITSPIIRIASISGTHLDRNTNFDVEYVWIKNSKTTHLPRFDAGIFFPNIRKYVITDSHLRFIEREDFSGMPKLETLDLTNNEIEEVPADTLLDLSELIDFYIDNNKVKTLPEDLLINAPAFQRLKAANNSLEILEADIFKHNPSLKIVTLDNNRFFKIKVDFRPFKNLKRIDLLNNPCINTNYNDWRQYKSIPIVQKEIELTCR